MLLQMKLSHQTEPPTFCHQLIATFAVYTCFVITLLIILAVPEKSPIPPNEEPLRICYSPECIQLAHQLHNWKDVSVDPCKDFYKYSCGKYNEQSTKDEASLIVSKLVQDVLQKENSSVFKSENDMKLYYQKCKEVTNEERSREILKAIEKVGSWPMMDREWDEPSFDLNEMLSNLAALGVTDLGFFNLRTTEDRFLQIEIEAAEFDRRKEEKMVHKFLQDNGQVLDFKKIKRDFKNLEKLNSKLSKISHISNDQKTIKTLENFVSSVDVKRIITKLLIKGETWTKIEDRIMVGNLTNIETILQTTSKRTMANFLILKLIGFLKNFEPHNTPGIDVIKSCTLKTIKNFPLPSFRIFVMNHFDKENLRMMSTMTDNIKESLIEMLQESTRLHNDTKKKAIQKLKSMKKIVGFPKEMEQPEALERFYETLDLSATDSFLAIQQKVSKFNGGLQLDYVASIIAMEPTIMYVGAGAFYKTWSNGLILSVPILNDPMFHPSYPTYARVASIGEVIGREIGRGLEPKYDNRAQCLKDRYRELNSTTTINDMSFHMIGLDASWRTFKKVDFSNENSIIGFEDEPLERLFFHLTATSWCQSQEKQDRSFGLNEMFSNTKQFAVAFNCPVGSPMNPREKCELFE